LGSLNDQNVPDWKLKLADCLALFGHRNWIVVADSAYPAQSSPGIETVVAAASQIEVVQAVAAAIAASTHTKALIHLDRELAFIQENDAPGVDLYRAQLQQTLSGAKPRPAPHDEIIARLDQSARLFQALIIKTQMTIPYTSVFFELDCRYWSAEAEQRLRVAMQAESPKERQ
jgi:L-fucose mutarotase/ribose pyranase (RbsD/FucU family)